MRYYNGERYVTGHSIHALLRNEEIEPADQKMLLEKGGLLDQFYIPARYPNGLPEGAPYEVYTAGQAEEAVRGAQAILDFAGRRLLKGQGVRD